MNNEKNGTGGVLDVADVVKRYGSLTALDGVSLHVDAGEFVALLGPNGAGKTTLFQLLTGLFVADAGSISVVGNDIRSKPVAALGAEGVVFQQPTLDLDMSVRANLVFHARLHGLGKRTGARIEAELERLEMLDSADAHCRTLSGGNRRKVELARALLHEPKVLLMDEATVGLDPASRRLINDYVHGLCAERGMAVLWATHLVDEAEGANRVIILHRGKIIATGAPTDITAMTGAHSLAAAFLELTGSGKTNKEES